MIPDAELLRRYTQAASEEAFGDAIDTAPLIAGVGVSNRSKVYERNFLMQEMRSRPLCVVSGLCPGRSPPEFLGVSQAGRAPD